MESAPATPLAAPATAAADARPTPMGGKKAKLASVAGSLQSTGTRAAILALLPRIDACFTTHELEPPSHETAAYELDVAAAGAVSRVEPAAGGSRAPRLDACVTTVLRTARLPRSASGGHVRVSFSAPR